jgi:general stress protein CsbA
VAGDWIEMVIGAWMIVSPWLLGFADITFAKWSSVLLGLVLVIISLFKLFGQPQKVS